MKNLHEKLKAFHAERNRYFLDEFNRMLPLGELVSDRWEKAEALGFGSGSNIYDSSIVMGAVTVGENTWIGPNTLLDGAHATLSIGDFCHVSAGVYIYTHDSVGRALTGGKAPLASAPVTIGDCVYIGSYAMLTKGVSVGNHCVIGAYSLVNKSLPDFSVAWGQPAKVVGRVILDDDGMGFSVEYF